MALDVEVKVIVLGLDPGPEESAWVAFDGQRVLYHAKEPNEAIRVHLTNQAEKPDAILVIEQIAAMGMAVGAEVFETCFWSGRFAEAWGHPFERLKRHEIKMHLCGNMRAKDANIRTALMDRFGGSKAVGRKASPGPLFGIAGDQWSALAVALTWYDTRIANRRIA